MFDGRILIVLHRRDRLLDQRHFEGAVGVPVGSAHVAVLTGLRLRVAAKFILETAVEPLEVSELFQVVAHRFLVRDRQVDRVTTAAHSGALHIRIVLRFDSERVVHRVGHDELVLEWSEHLIGFAHFELTRDRVFEEMFQRRHALRRFGFDNVMAGGAAHAVAGQRAVFEVRLGHARFVNELAIEIRVPPVIEIELAFAHDAVAAKTGVHHFLRELLAFGLVLEGL